MKSNDSKKKELKKKKITKTKKGKKSKTSNKKENFKKVKIFKSESNIVDYCKNKKIIYTLISIIIFIIIFLFLLYYLKSNSSSNNEYIKIGKDYKLNDTIDENTYNQIIQEFININSNGELIYDKKSFKKNKNPKISVIITVHNGEAFMKQVIRVVQNQDFHDVEIIIVEDASKDKSVQIVKELMKEDPRIVFLENQGNRGYLYSLKKGIVNSKGKYITILDVDDYFAGENVLSILYEQSEKENLDILGFGATQGEMDMNTFKFKHTSFHNYIETQIIHQPEISELAYTKNNNGEIVGIRDVVWGYLYKAEFAIKAANEIDEKKYLQVINNNYADTLLFYILTKRAKSMKNIKKILYVTIQKKNSGNSIIKYFTEEKYMVRAHNRCATILTFIEFTFMTSDNNMKYASYLLKNLFLKTECERNKSIRNEAIRICKLFLESQYIENKLKDRINSYLN